MGVFYNAGETKIRPGVYQRYTNRGTSPTVSAQDGLCAIPIKATWGPLASVVKNTRASQLIENYGDGTYASTTYTVPAATALFDGGASTVYTYRLGTGGTAASLKIEENKLTITAKYVGTFPISVSIAEKIGDSTTKVISVYANSSLVETFEFAADGTTEGANLVAAVADSEYIGITMTTEPETVSALAVASGALAGGVNPTVSNTDYSNAFEAFEPYFYNTITLDVDDDANMTLSLLLQAYLDEAYTYGKLAIAVVGEKTSVTFSNRIQHAKAFNDAKVVYLGGGFMAGTVSKDGWYAICYTAGLIAATPSNQGITHTTVSGATALCESLTYEQYETAITSGMLMLSMSNDGSIWYDSGINTLTSLASNEDEGWKKIRRVKVRFEMLTRIDNTLAPKVGKISADSDGVADVIQSAQRVLNTMADSEGKLQPGPTIFEDPDNPYNADSAWFIIQADDIDSLEKIYLQYQFRYSQNS